MLLVVFLRENFCEGKMPLFDPCINDFVDFLYKEGYISEDKYLKYKRKRKAFNLLFAFCIGTTIGAFLALMLL